MRKATVKTTTEGISAGGGDAASCLLSARSAEPARVLIRGRCTHAAPDGRSWIGAAPGTAQQGGIVPIHEAVVRTKDAASTIFARLYQPPS